MNTQQEKNWISIEPTLRKSWRDPISKLVFYFFLIWLSGKDVILKFSRKKTHNNTTLTSRDWRYCMLLTAEVQETFAEGRRVSIGFRGKYLQE